MTYPEYRACLHPSPAAIALVEGFDGRCSSGCKDSQPYEEDVDGDLCCMRCGAPWQVGPTVPGADDDY